MRNLTKHQESNIRQAIEAAEKPGKCRYEDGGAPCCVIGQLAHLEGVESAVLEIWDCLHPSGVRAVRPPALEDYPMAVLGSLQKAWDDADTAMGGRAAMRLVLEEWGQVS